MTDKVLSPYIKSLALETPNLTPQDLQTVIRLIVRGVASDVQTAAFLTALRLRGLDTKGEFIAAAVTAILEFSSIVDRSKVAPEGYVDIVGTGGDGQNTFNVSTSAAIVAAGAGLKVCKHGGKALTLTSGSGDFLKSLGVDIMKVNADTAPQVVSQSDFCFLFAPAFHAGMGKVAPIRAQLALPTIFNILGPLINPIPLRSRVLGVYSEALGEEYAKASLELNRDSEVHLRTVVVWGEVGLDEVSPIGGTKVWIVENGTITRTRISPGDFGLPEHDLELVRSGTPDENAEQLLHILRQDDASFTATTMPCNHPLVDYILINTAMLLYAEGSATSLREGVSLAVESIASGSALAALEGFKTALNNL